MNTRKRSKAVLTFGVLAVAIVGLAGVSAQAAVMTMTTTANSTGSGNTLDNWNSAGNWDTNVPTVTDSAVISDGLAASAYLAAPTYSGGLTMGDGSSLTIQDQGLNVVTAGNAIGTGTITMNNSTLDVKTRGTVSFGAIDLVGNSTITATANSGDSRGRNLTGVISGDGAFTIFGRNKQVWNWDQTNTFSGGLTLNAIDRHEMRLNAAGSAGSGDVTVSPRTGDGRSAVVIVNVADVFADTSTLTLNGNGWDGSSGGSHAGQSYKIIMNADDTIAGLIVDSVAMPFGAYTNSEAWLTGNGTLTVAPADPNLPDVDAGDNWITWSGQAVTLDATVANNDTAEPQGTLTYAWTADPASVADGNLTIDITPDVTNPEDATIEITKTDPTGDVTVVTMTLTVTLAGTDPVASAMTIDVYDDACEAAKGTGSVVFDPGDVDENCITNLKDFAVVAAKWLDDYTSTGPLPKL